jgi:hypothetical protein
MPMPMPMSRVDGSLGKTSGTTGTGSSNTGSSNTGSSNTGSSNTGSSSSSSSTGAAGTRSERRILGANGLPRRRNGKQQVRDCLVLFCYRSDRRMIIVGDVHWLT